jgi:transcriptional regulator with XRE-family HTH domain
MAAAPNRLVHLRRAAGLTQKQVAALLELDASTVSRYETGQTGMPDEVKVTLAVRFGVSVAHLMGWDGDGDGDPAQKLAAA